MRTRTLLLLAVGCGLAILAAGTVFLLGLASDEPVAYVAVGQPVDVGDVRVTVMDYVESGDHSTVSVRIGGVDDPDGSAAFRLVVGSAKLAAVAGDPAEPEGLQPCGALTEVDVECTLTFDMGSDPPGGSRVLRYDRGEDSAVWALQS